MSDLRIQAIAFEPDALIVSFVELPTDVRVNGRVVVQRQIQLSLEHPDYAEDADGLHARAVKAVRNALEDWTNSEPHMPEAEDDDDERGMGE